MLVLTTPHLQPVSKQKKFGFGPHFHQVRTHEKTSTTGTRDTCPRGVFWHAGSCKKKLIQAFGPLRTLLVAPCTWTELCRIQATKILSCKIRAVQEKGKLNVNTLRIMPGSLVSVYKNVLSGQGAVVILHEKVQHWYSFKTVHIERTFVAMQRHRTAWKSSPIKWSTLCAVVKWTGCVNYQDVQMLQLPSYVGASIVRQRGRSLGCTKSKNHREQRQGPKKASFHVVTNRRKAEMWQALGVVAVSDPKTLSDIRFNVLTQFTRNSINIHAFNGGLTGQERLDGSLQQAGLATLLSIPVSDGRDCWRSMSVCCLLASKVSWSYQRSKKPESDTVMWWRCGTCTVWIVYSAGLSNRSM